VKTREEMLAYQRAASLKYYYANKEKSAERAKKWRSKNKEYVQTKQRENKRLRKIKAIEYLGGQCNKCEKNWHPAIYEFHHTDPTTKDRDPSKMLMLSWKRLKSELDKCKLLCANCHRLIHHEENY
jgi:hypothetical protein